MITVKSGTIKKEVMAKLINKFNFVYEDGVSWKISDIVSLEGTLMRNKDEPKVDSKIKLPSMRPIGNAHEAKGLKAAGWNECLAYIKSSNKIQ